MELFYNTDYFTDLEIDHLKTHKYQSSGYSVLDTLLQPFWEGCAKLLPYVTFNYLIFKMLTPNMVTLLGLLVMGSSVLMIYSFDNKFEIEMSNFQYIYLAISFLVYQTLDAIDGKHARNTKRSSPLGMLMDHGCDSIINSFVLVHIFQAYKFKGHLIIIVVQGLTQVNF